VIGAFIVKTPVPSVVVPVPETVNAFVVATVSPFDADINPAAPIVPHANVPVPIPIDDELPPTIAVIPPVRPSVVVVAVVVPIASVAPSKVVALSVGQVIVDPPVKVSVDPEPRICVVAAALPTVICEVVALFPTDIAADKPSKETHCATPVCKIEVELPRIFVMPADRPTLVPRDALPISTLVNVMLFELIDGEIIDVADTWPQVTAPVAIEIEDEAEP
jgi:hypothetical protein